MKIFFENINRIIKGEIIHLAGNPPIESLLTDSRKLAFPTSSLFFAIRTKKQNGHLYIEELYNKGVRAFIVSEKIPLGSIPEANVLLVPDPVKALQQLAGWHREQFDLPVIGITGSNGKTVVKEWLNQLLETRYRIVRSPKSYNSQIGVPLSLWQINEWHQLGIFEAGISKPGEMQRLQSLIKPDLGIFTNLGAAHNEGFESSEQKAKEKAFLFRHAKTIVYCRDHELVHQAIQDLIIERPEDGSAGLNLWSWTLGDKDAALRVKIISRTQSGTELELDHGNKKMNCLIPFEDSASIENAIHCISVMLYLNYSEPEIREKISLLTAVEMRLELKEGINNCSVINDSYSSDLSSLPIALDFLAAQKQYHKHTVILSDLLETGKPESWLYTTVSDYLKNRNIQRLIGIGTEIYRNRDLFDLPDQTEKIFFSSVEAFQKAFPTLAFGNEVVLIKGARVYGLETVSRMLEKKTHETVLEIDLNALLHNLDQFKRLLNPGTKVMAMVKAFSYGSGSFEIANLLQFHHVDYLGVAYADEGVELRKHGVHLPIMVMNTNDSTFDSLLRYNLEPELYSMAVLQELQQYLQLNNIREFPVHIEIETGMNRLGFAIQEIPFVMEIIQTANFRVKSVFTHLVGSEDPELDAFTSKQMQLFTEAVNQVRSGLDYPVLAHISNTSGVSRHPGMQMDLVRLGIGLYGIDSGHNPGLQLKNVSTLKSTIAQIKKLRKGDTVGYGRKGLVKKDSVIATVRIGYADGYPRRLGNGVGRMLVNGHFAPVLGSVCMDMTMIDISGIAGVQEGGEVIVFGEALPVMQLAEQAQTIPYEILTGISQRVKRIYFQE